MRYERDTDVDPTLPLGDSVRQAILDEDCDISRLYEALNDTDKAASLKIDYLEPGSPGGVCPLNSSIKVDNTYLPVMTTDKFSDGINVPVGSIIMWASDIAPSGWLECDGSYQNEGDYPDLFEIIGRSYGGDSNSTTFRVPDLRGYFVRGWDHNASRDPDAYRRSARGDGSNGDAVGTVQAGQNPAHQHKLLAQAVSGTSNGAAYFYGINTSQPKATLNTGGTEFRPINIALMYIIKT